MEESNIVITKQKIKFKNFWIWFKDQVKRMCTPVGFIPAMIITVMLEILFPGLGVFNFFSTHDKYILGLVLLYIGPMWMTYFAGVFKGESLQTKYNVDNIN